MSKKISAAEYPISKVFSSDFDYVVPFYQRPYAWEIEHASELFDDLYDFYDTKQEEDYFLGSIVLIKEDGVPRSEIIDGQQRLTTLTILLTALASEVEDEEFKGSLKDYIIEKGKPAENIKPKPRLTLRERDREFFKDYVQGFRLNELCKPITHLENDAQQNIRANTKVLLEKLRKEFKDNKNDIKKFASFLLTRCSLVVVSHPDKDTAFRLFSVLNDRGLNLRTVDILKAHIVGKISQDKQEIYTKKWEDIEEQTGTKDFQELFIHIHAIYKRKRARTARALQSEFKDRARKKTPMKFIDEMLKPYADAYLIAKEPQQSKYSEEVNQHLEWLNRLDNNDWLPPAIEFLYQHQKKEEDEYVEWFFRKLERLATYFLTCSVFRDKRISRYVKVLEGLEDDHSFDEKIESIELSEKEKKEMREALNDNIYEHLTTVRRNYILLRLDSFLSDGAATYNPRLRTIEHVLPQTVDEGSEWAQWWSDKEEREEWVHRLANLVLLNQSRNSKAQNFDFKRKKDEYFGGKEGVTSFALTTKVLKEDTWTPAVVARRQKDLLSLLSKHWELNPSPA